MKKASGYLKMFLCGALFWAGSSVSVAVEKKAEELKGVKQEPLPVEIVQAFPNLRFRRPILVTHAGDGSDRVFIAEQYGTVRVLPNNQDAEETTVFLDIEDQVRYSDNENEEGFLGLAFHPKYEENGEFFAYYTTREVPHTSVISRFRVSKDNPNKADPNFEEEIMRIKQPFWNHNGGTIIFGPDGYLYIGLGDGGKANDPLGAGQDKSLLLGSILRIDIDRKEDGKNYAIPADNPFVDEADARGEIYAYGFRNVWRIAFDNKTGALWAADVGQNLWEEINIVEKGGNYGWNIREGLHKFAGKSDETPKGLIDPIWEYHHSVGKSITGGTVYRGKRVPELVGKYVYGDYVTNKFWALDYDYKAEQVLANYSIPGGENKPVMSFGEDESGELYFTDGFGRIFWFASGE